jgi:RNA polymerase sigma-70 factor (ECF subfamily)
VYKALTSAEEIQNTAAVKSWLCRIVVNTALDYLRKRARETPAAQLPEEGRGDVYQDMDTLKALDVLDEKERTVIVLRFFEDLRLQDVAQITGENLNTVKTTLYRSLKKLKVQLTENQSASL